MNQRLLDVLLAWRSEVMTRGLPAPPVTDLQRIAANARKWPAGEVEIVTEAWRAAIEFLEVQVRFGVHEPLTTLSDSQWAAPASVQPPRTAIPLPGNPQPAAPATSAEPASTQPSLDELVARLRTWSMQKGDDDGPLARMSEARLRQVAQSTPQNRKAMLTGFRLGSYIDEITAILEAREPQPPTAAVVPPDPQPEPDIDHSADVAPAPVIAAPREEPAPQLLDVGPEGFAECIFTAPEVERETISVRVSVGKSLSLSWNAPHDGEAVHLFRVIGGDDDEPWSPDFGRVLAVTTDTAVEDTEPFTGAVRYLQVWCNSGASVREAKAAQPVCIAEKRVVSPVLDFTLREEAGTVTGEWDVFDGIERVQVYRVPADRMRQGGQSPAYRIEADEDNLVGFKDDGADQGGRYVYQAVAEIVVDGVVLTSAPVERVQLISVVLERVNDLEVSFTEGDDDFFDVIWTAPPRGRVSIYRGQKRPEAGIEDKELAVEALAGANLLDDNRISPVKRNIEPGRDGMRRVPWPASWSRAYFTPVTILNSRAVVGRTVARTRVPMVRDAELVERVNEQLLTFSWPSGAAAVWVYQHRRHTDASLLPATARPTHEISAATWRDLGGHHFIPPLPRDGCAVHLCAVAFQEGETYRSEFATLDYAGLRVVRYRIRRRKSRLTVEMSTDTPGSMPPIRYTLIANNERFPLDLRDGHPINLASSGVDGAPPEPTISPVWSGSQAAGEWFADVNFRPGRYFLRLFADLDPQHLKILALMDPPMSDLVLDIQ